MVQEARKSWRSIRDKPEAGMCLALSANALGEKIIEPSQDRSADRPADKAPDQPNEAAERSDAVSKVEVIEEHGSGRLVSGCYEPPGRDEYAASPPNPKRQGKSEDIELDDAPPA